ncbi:uncharacterized protein CANTADRAFT_44147 [Suhomyces tanzawaensis NRRL Y-17324]|uniref:glucan endo-1,3-beta-D-glucosidase n=1 Tax=Suhomyces tanzawaensis NRRL Y-17324 TaxID=984487 RepID=A0A1E4SPU8_9ASCO|nr:uncharacterized protein CANTADRAFT_44147 [Suhomyces tanzawaensis NRRL Y-17324]ODV81544.1 hypothetical protein CANTADRAFT_44147 [Suhomyces tanzawaensis NRRL Y-17324]
MKFTYTALMAVLAATVQAGCTNDGGNWYCSETNKVIYQGVGYSGSYQDVTNMDEKSGTCTQQSKAVSGNLAPLDEELSVHFRGPLRLKEFAVYYPGNSKQNNKRDEEECTSAVIHKHHKHKRATQVVEVTQTVFVNGEGQTVTSQATHTVGSTGLPAADISPLDGQGKAYRSLSTLSAPTTTSGGPATASAVPSGAWSRSSHYTPGNTDNCVFMNYFGGSGSGVWSAAFGNSLSYANSDASGGSSSPVALQDTTLKSNQEYVIFSGSKCSGNDCGYYREGTPAYHGFGGASKLFVFEFEMPSDNSGSGFNQDMPAIWMLNAKVPRTLQYGNAQCSCWSTGCGELDLFEVLAAGSDKCVNHLHDGQGKDGSAQGGGGSSDYFKRPTSGSLKAAVIFVDSEVHILSVDEDFSATLSEETVQGWISQPGSKAIL